MPAIGTMAGTECGSPVTLVRTNNGCMNNNFSIPFPVDNYQGAGSATGTLPTIVIVPTWTQTTQSLFSASRPKPWIYYDGALDPDSPRFLQDYVYCPDRAFIQSQMADALDNVQLENQIRILPDGTIMMTHIWTDQKGRPWISTARDGFWLAPDSAPNGRVFYFDPTRREYVEPFANGQNRDGMFLTMGSGWVGYFIDQLRPSFGLGFCYGPAAEPSIFPADYWPNGPSVLFSNYFTYLTPGGRAFRQAFLVIGTKEEMQAKSAVLNDYVFVFDPAHPPAAPGVSPDFD